MASKRNFSILFFLYVFPFKWSILFFLINLLFLIRFVRLKKLHIFKMLFFGWRDFISFRSLGKLISCLKRSKSKNLMPENLPQRHWYVSINHVMSLHLWMKLKHRKQYFWSVMFTMWKRSSGVWCLCVTWCAFPLHALYDYFTHFP